MTFRFLTFSLVAALACGGGDGGGADATQPSAGNGPEPPVSGLELTDADMSALARASSGWTYYKLRSDTLMRSTGSGHTSARLRTRYNSRAAAQLDGTGKVRPGAIFADSSLIVKELITGETLDRYAVMMKMQGSENAGAGWLWAYYAPDGSPQISITTRGGSCVACHSTGIDQTRMNDSHP